MKWPAVALLGLALTACEGADDPTPALPDVAPAKPALDPAVEAAVRRGRELFFGRAVCSTCHKADGKGTMIVGPNMGVGDDMREPFAVRAAKRRPELTPIEYAIESILDPNAVVVPTYAPGVMKTLEDVGVELDDEELVALAAFVAMQGAPTPISVEDLQRAREQIPPARAARAARRGAATERGDKDKDSVPAP